MVKVKHFLSVYHADLCLNIISYAVKMQNWVNLRTKQKRITYATNCPTLTFGQSTSPSRRR